jgi:Holliday junction resolvasome RuvABC endonuclease subunit
MLSFARSRPCRYMGIDPATSCGFAIVQLNADAQIISLDVGVLDVDKSSTRGAQGNDLKRQLLPLLTPPPDFVFIEDYHVHAYQDPKTKRWGVNQNGVDLNYKLRMAVEMTLDECNVEYDSVTQNEWKKHVADDGNADKDIIKQQIEHKMGVRFPEYISASGRRSRDQKKKADASDVRTRHAARLVLCTRQSPVRSLMHPMRSHSMHAPCCGRRLGLRFTACCSTTASFRSRTRRVFVSLDPVRARARIVMAFR